MSDIEFKPFPKIARLNRECIITEKIDGTNGCIVITEDGRVAAQSRNRLLTVENDAFGFAAWVEANADQLRSCLGPGHHFGEWWGKGIQRGYGLRERHFSLFNVERWWAGVRNVVLGLDVVPLLYRGPFETPAINAAVSRLRVLGSVAAPGFMKPEGVIVYHVAGGVGFKVTCEKDEERKGPQRAEVAL